jgi:parallel beta-helix repeat protein
MRHQAFAMLAVGGTLLLILAPVGAAAGPVGCGDIITEDTVLDQDLDCSGTEARTALTVEGPATLDLNGHVLTCDVRAFGVALTRGRARLVDGTVTGCIFAVALVGDGRHTVRDVTLTENTVGIDSESPGNRIERNWVDHFGQAIRVIAPDNRVIGNYIDGTGPSTPPAPTPNLGIELAGRPDSAADSTTVIGNVVIGSIRGIELNTDGNAIRANQLSDNTFGIVVEIGAESNVLTGNHAEGNDVDLLDENFDCDDNDWRGNSFDSARPEDCID